MRLLPLVLALLQPAQTQGQGLARLAGFLETNGRAAIVTLTMTTKYTSSLVNLGTCRATLRVLRETDVSASVTDYHLVLRELSPEVTVAAVGAYGVFRVSASTTSGSSDIQASRSTASGGPGSSMTTLHAQIAVGGRSSADSVGSLLAAAIRDCGGKPQTPEAARRAQASRDSASRGVDELVGNVVPAFVGNTIPPEVRQRTIYVCQARANEKLRSPRGTNFALDHLLFRTVGEDGLYIAGQVEVVNALGVSRQASYSCTFEKFGSQFVPRTVLVH